MTVPDALRQKLLAALSEDGAASSDFDLNKDVPARDRKTLRPAAVLILITQAGEVYLTKRSSKLKHHPGQISFPGGKVDAGDHGVIGAALREAREEIGLPENLVEVLGQLPCHETVTGFEVVPVVALLKAPFDVVVEPGEVEEVFTVPLSHVLDETKFSVEGRMWLGQRRHYYVVPWGPYYIWGATARMLRALAARMAS